MIAAHFHKRRFGLCAIAALLIALAGFGAPSPLGAQQSDIYFIRVPVDVTEKNATVARDRALREGQKLALFRLMRRMTMQEDHANLPQIDATQIEPLVIGLEVSDERTSDVRYLSNLTVRFTGQGVRDLLRNAGVRFAETRSRPILALPIWREGGQVFLWDMPNPWWTAWAGMSERGGLTPILAPVGDLTDIADIGPQFAILKDAGRMARMARRYGARDMIVATAALSEAEDGRLVSVTVDKKGAVDRPRMIQSSYALPSGDVLEVALARIAEEIVVAIEEDWKRKNLIAYGYEQLLDIHVPIGALPEWVRVRKRLGAVPVVRRHRVVSLRRDMARIEVAFQGDLEQLRTALAQNDLEMRAGNGVWLLGIAPGTGEWDRTETSVPKQDAQAEERIDGARQIQ